ncbi:UPF0175 family protein [Lentibacillus sp. CBA3610]|uniref:UPF0175 family protein n=1 Tax=Lentibacillus sp. CBA3610 TaxID=2518176 RepID=UPI0015957929|nr:UPF0175 family protein [Lentibacillus sp. CBA3610]QKY68811.1 UPF0175 family protein [Lentibacillus sp. CBA3610]
MNRSVDLPKEFLPIINTMEGTDTDNKIKETLAIGLFVEKQVTLARAAELAGKPMTDFIELLRSKKIPWMEYTDEHLEDDRQVIQELSRDYDDE